MGIKINLLDKLRLQINIIDKDMANLFEQRMKIVKEIGEFKSRHHIKIIDTEREKNIIKKNSDYIKNKNIKIYYQIFLKECIKTAKHYQQNVIELENKNRDEL